MIRYPKKLEFTELEEQYILDKLSYSSLSVIIDDILFCLDDTVVKKCKTLSDLEDLIKEGFNHTELQDTINTPSHEELDVLKKKLEGRKIFRKKYTEPIFNAVWITVGEEEYACSKDPIVLGDYYYRPSTREVYRGTGWQDGDFKVVASTDPEILKNIK